MRKVIDHKVYDTETATLVGDWDNDEEYMDLHYVAESLYRKRTGEYFVLGAGGAATNYCRYEGANRYVGGERIMPVSYDEAEEWAERHLDPGIVQAEFGASEDAEDTHLTIVMDGRTRSLLDREAARTGKPRGRIICELIAENLDK